MMLKFLFSFVFFSITVSLWGQVDKKQLEKRKAQIEKEIRMYQDLLKQETKKEKSVLTKIEEKDAKIKLVEELITNSKEQAKILDQEIDETQKNSDQLFQDLTKIKEDYASMIVKSYKSRSEQSLYMFLLSSESFLQAYKRFQYMKQYANYRQKQGILLKTKTDELYTYTQRIALQKNEKEKLILENETIKKTLEHDIKDQERLIASIKKDKIKHTNAINKKKQESIAIDKQINKLVKEMIAQANLKAKKETSLTVTKKENTTTVGSNKPVGSNASNSSDITFNLTPENKIIATDFKMNKGKFPWPVEKGILTLGYGNQPHPLQKNLVIHNSGIEITTNEGMNARAIFSGEVLTVQMLTSNNKAVYIQHGDFITIYLNLNHVFVKKGDKVVEKQHIGKIHTNGTTGKTILKFLVLQNTTILNPQQWLVDMN